MTAATFQKGLFGDGPTQDHIQLYYRRYYGTKPLHPKILEQLQWLQQSYETTPESNVRLSENPNPDNFICPEVKRALTRYHCWQLLLDGSQKAYEQFTISQADADKLSWESFVNNLPLDSLTAPIIEAATATCFLTITDTAKEKALAAGVAIPADWEMFLSVTLQNCPQIYPIWDMLSPEAKKLLPAAYYPDTHLRHMLYTEGGDNMFVNLKKLMLLQDERLVWLARWVINIAGFRGHEFPMGSVYFTQGIAAALQPLTQEMIYLAHHPKHDILTAYLQKRAELLQLDNELYLAHLACLMRIYSPALAQELKKGFAALPHAMQEAAKAQYEKFRKTVVVTPTYTPAVLDNLLALKCSIGETVGFYQVLMEAINQLVLAQNKEWISGLCFRNLAKKENLSILLEKYRAGELRHDCLSLKENGELAVVIAPKAVAQLR